jgi:EpsI family protein
MSGERGPIEPVVASPAVPAGSSARLGGVRGRGAAAWAMGLLALAVVAFAFRALLTFRPTGSITVDVEGWFFEPSDTSPMVVVAVSLWLLYRRTARLAALEWVAGPLALTLVLYAGAIGVFSWALLTEASDLQAIALILAGFGTANLLGGRPALRAVWLPLCFLLFALPIPSPLRHAIVWKFQNWTAEATGFLLYLLGIPAVVSGDRIVLARSVFAVIETCSGMRSVITLSMLAVLMIDLFRRSGLHAFLVLVFTPFLAFGTNALRCLGLVLNPKSDIASIHSLQGIGMLLASVLVLYAFDGLLERLEVPGGRPAPVVRSGPVRPVRARLAWVGAFVALLVALSLAIAPWRFVSPEVALPSEAIPRQLGAWRSVDIETDRLFLGMAALAGSIDRRYVRAGDSVDVFVASGSPRQRLRSFYSEKTALPGSGWIVEEKTRGEVAGRAVDVLVVRKDAERRLVYHWYLGTSGFLEELARDALALDLSPWARTWRAAVVRLATPLEGPRARERAEARLAEMATLLSDSLNRISAPPGEPKSAESAFHFFPGWENLFRRSVRDPMGKSVLVRMVIPSRSGGTHLALSLVAARGSSDRVGWEWSIGFARRESAHRQRNLRGT